LEVKAEMGVERTLMFRNTHGKVDQSENDSCISMFNPEDALAVKFIKSNWSKAIKYFFEGMVRK